MLIGVDVGGTKIAILVTTDLGQPVAELRRPTQTENLIVCLIQAIWDAIAKAETAVADIRAIGIGIPGMVNREGGTVELAVNLQIVQPLRLVEQLSAEFNLPIILENDARLAALGVYQQLRLPNFAYLNIGTGVAAGIIRDSQLWRGRNGMAGEVGQLVLDETGTILEQLVSGPAIIRQAQAKSLAVEQAGDVYRLAIAGNRDAQQVVVEASIRISRIIQWLIMTYDVERIVLGGGVTRIGDAFLRPILTELANLRAYSALNHKMLPDEIVQLLPHSVNVGLHGAIFLAQQAF